MGLNALRWGNTAAFCGAFAQNGERLPDGTPIKHGGGDCVLGFIYLLLALWGSHTALLRVLHLLVGIVPRVFARLCLIVGDLCFELRSQVPFGGGGDPFYTERSLCIHFLIV